MTEIETQMNDNNIFIYRLNLLLQVNESKFELIQN